MGEVVSHTEIAGLPGEGEAVHFIISRNKVSLAVEDHGPVVNIMALLYSRGTAHDIHGVPGCGF